MFIDENKIDQLINESCPKDGVVDDVLNKALKLQGLTVEDAAVLLNIQDKKQLDKLFKAAATIKDTIYGKRLVLFSPLYVSNYCSNNCLYCGFRNANKELDRKVLSMEQIREEVRLILEQGHKRVLMLMGEHPRGCSFDYFLESLNEVYKVKDSHGSSIRRVNVEVAPLTTDEFAKLKKCQIGTYTVFQETYHRETYKEMHPAGKKSDYEWRLSTMDRALENGLHDVGIGALFGLYDYRFETLSLISHAHHLDKTFGVGPHTISVPRIEPADNAPAALNIPHPVDDVSFKKIVSILRCAVPYTGIILSTRESAEMREELFNLGVSQISAGSKTNIGGYAEDENKQGAAQFTLSDTRSTDEVIQSVIEQGYIPSFCTGCYRLGRVGQDFMEMAKPGMIQIHCQPNAILTLKEYLMDYADENTRKAGEKLIEKELSMIPNEARVEATRKFLKQVEEGKRDIYF